jgi:SAM-dependent methyltransferase
VVRKKLGQWLPKLVKDGLKFAYRSLLDGADVILSRRRDLVPPRRLIFVGNGDFVETGDEFFRYFADLCDLKADQSVLEVGCGIGRMARPVTRYLIGGSYDGIDIVPSGIFWCQRNVSCRYPNFKFHLADVYNKTYNPHGNFQAVEYRFPFPDAKFDFVFLTSVFTHMLPRDMERYLREVLRCLRPAGRCLITFFLLNKESRGLIRAGQSSINFKFPLPGCWVNHARMPENAVAYDEAQIQSLYSELGLGLQTTKFGAWCGRPEYLSYQDILIARKPELT